MVEIDTSVPDPAQLRVERAAVGLVSAAHFFSHFYLLVVPFLFLSIQAEMGLSFTQLGLITALYAAGSAGGQFIMGIYVDRHGPRWFLIFGLLIVALAYILMGMATAYWMLLALGFVAGLGDSVFHPADFSVITAAVHKDRLGRSYAFHAFAGFAGFGAAALVVPFVNSLVNWHVTLIIMGAAGVVMTAILYIERYRFEMMSERPEEERTKKSGTVLGDMKKFASMPPILMLFFFYVMVAWSGQGIQQFSPAALPILYGVGAAGVSTAVFGFLFSITIGILVGGYLADKTTRFNLIASLGYGVSIALLIAVAMVVLPFSLVVASFALAGFLSGLVMPSRDMLVSAISPPGAAGKAFGFVNMGFGFGGMISPVIFGLIMDTGFVPGVYYGTALFMFFAIVTALVAARYAAVPQGEPQPAE